MCTQAGGSSREGLTMACACCGQETVKDSGHSSDCRGLEGPMRLISGSSGSNNSIKINKGHFLLLLLQYGASQEL